MAIDQQLRDLGYTEVVPDTWELIQADDVAWMVECDPAGYSLSEWRELPRMWQRVAIYFDADLLIATLQEAAS